LSQTLYRTTAGPLGARTGTIQPWSSSLQYTPWPRPPRPHCQRTTDLTDLPPCVPSTVPDHGTSAKLVSHCRNFVSTCFIAHSRSRFIVLPASPRVLPVSAKFPLFPDLRLFSYITCSPYVHVLQSEYHFGSWSPSPTSFLSIRVPLNELRSPGPQLTSVLHPRAALTSRPRVWQ
jgi:hypothetical protein